MAKKKKKAKSKAKSKGIITAKEIKASAKRPKGVGGNG